MIKSYCDSDTENLANNRYVKKFDSIQNAARKKLGVIKAAKGLGDLAAVPGNKLEVLHRNREGQYSIRINDQYRICFIAEGDDFKDVEIVDYHA